MSGAPSVIVSHSEEETAELAARLAASLAPGSVVLLSGELGAGKTAFVRGMAAGLGIDPTDVSSPTFTLIQEYRPQPAEGSGPGSVERGEPRARPTLFHVDLYRLEPAETEDLGIEELAAGGGIVAIEWAEKLARPPARALRVSISDEGEDTRTLTITEN